VLVALFATTTAGCAQVALRKQDIARAAGEHTPESLSALVAARRAGFHGLRATGKLQVTVDARRGAEIRRNRFRTSQAILVASPSSFRLEALSPFGVTYAVASDGAEIAVLIPSEGIVYRGVADLETVAAATGVVATPADVTELLLGQPPVPELDLANAWISGPGLAATQADLGATALTPEILLHATVRGDPDDLVVVGFAAADSTAGALVPVLYERITGAGDLVLRARLGAFRASPPGPFATRVEIQAGGSEAILSYGDLEVNPAIEASGFVIPTPAGAQERRLDLDAGDPRHDPA
jgi:hypothetical protein